MSITVLHRCEFLYVSLQIKYINLCLYIARVLYYILFEKRRACAS